MVRRSLLFVFLSSLTFVAAGCGGNTLSAPGAVPVKGQVQVKGKPLAGVLVTFHPKFNIGAVKFKPSGLTDKDGRFTISTAAPYDGAPPGEYTVTFTFPRAASDRKTRSPAPGPRCGTGTARRWLSG